MTPDIWPFKTQKEYDTFNSHLKGDNRNLRESAIRSWIEARNKPKGEKECKEA